MKNKIWQFIKRHPFWPIMFSITLLVPIVVSIPTTIGVMPLHIGDMICRLTGMLMAIAIVIKIISYIRAFLRRGQTDG